MERIGLARVLVGGVRAVVRAVPPKWRKRIEDRFFYAVFQTTRVTNDAYGWKPPEPPPDKEDEP